MKRWKGKFTGRKGMGMELALLVLLVVFGCSTLLVSSAMIGKSNLDRQEDRLTQRTELDQIAESFIAADKTISWTKNGETYDWNAWTFSWTPPEGVDAYIFLKDERDPNNISWPNPKTWIEGIGVTEETVEGQTVVSVNADITGIRLVLHQDGAKVLTVTVENGAVTEWTYH